MGSGRVFPVPPVRMTAVAAGRWAYGWTGESKLWQGREREFEGKKVRRWGSNLRGPASQQQHEGREASRSLILRGAPSCPRPGISTVEDLGLQVPRCYRD